MTRGQKARLGSWSLTHHNHPLPPPPSPMDMLTTTGGQGNILTGCEGWNPWGQATKTPPQTRASHLKGCKKLKIS